MDDGNQKGGIPQRLDECPEEKYLYKFVRGKICGNTSNPDVWRHLGIILIGQGSIDALNAIKINNPGNVKQCCSEMLSLWLQMKPKANWSQLINALKEVELYTLADNIEKSLLPTIEQQEFDTGPVITSHPKSIQIQEGQHVTLEVRVCGTIPLQYQWYHNFGPLRGENKADCFISSVTKSKTGYYHCEVKSQNGIEKSKFAMVTIKKIPALSDSEIGCSSLADSRGTSSSQLDTLLTPSSSRELQFVHKKCMINELDEEVQREYASFMTKLLSLFNEKQISKDDVLFMFSSLEGHSAVTVNMKSATNLQSFLLELRNTKCWFNFGTIATLACTFGENSGKELVEVYEQKLKVHLVEKITYLPREDFMTETIEVKVDEKKEYFTEESIIIFRNLLAKCLKLEPEDFVFISVESGCVKLTFLFLSKHTAQIKHSIASGSNDLIQLNVLLVTIKGETIWLSKISRGNKRGHGNIVVEAKRPRTLSTSLHATTSQNPNAVTSSCPVITSHPQDVEIHQGHCGTLDVSAYGAMPLHYQWYHENSLLHGENKTFYTIFPATERNVGHYYCVINNQCGEVKTNIAKVTILLTSPTSPVVESKFTYSQPAQGCALSNDSAAYNQITADSTFTRQLKCGTLTNWMGKFGAIFAEIQEIIKKQKLNIRSLIFKLIALDAKKITIFSTDKVFKEVQSVDGLFVHIGRYCTVFDYELLEAFLVSTKCTKAINLLNSFTKELMSSAINELDLWSVKEKVGTTLPQSHTLTVKYEGEQCTLNVEKIIRKAIFEYFDLTKGSIILVGVKKGCVTLLYQISPAVKSYLQQYPKTDEDFTLFSIAYKIKCLFIDDKELKAISGDVSLTTASSILVNYYARKETIPLEYVWPTCLIDNYIPITIFCLKEKYFKSEAISVARMLSSIGSMTHGPNSTAYGKITESINDLFAFYEESTSLPYVLHLNGAAGIGKSTLCKEIAIQWAHKDILKNKDLLFLLFLHDPKVKKITDVGLLAKYFFHSDILASKITEYLLENDGKCLTIIIDGYNENYGNSFITNDIIGRKILKQCDIVITSRFLPASLHLHKIINYRALVLGFTKNNQFAFYDNALKNLNCDISYLKNYLHCNPLIDSLCNIPLIMNLLLSYVKENNLEKSHQVKLIQDYIMTITQKKITTVNSGDLPHPYDQMIEILSRFAFIAVQEDHYAFTVNEILESCESHFQVHWHKLGLLNEACTLGLLNFISYKEQSVLSEIFHFSHVIIQEYLAASYISSLPDNELSTLLNSTFWNTGYFNIWVMYVGITGGKNSVFKLFLSDSLTCGTFGASVKIPSNKISICFYQLDCMKEADSDLDYTLLGQDIDLNNQKLSYDHLHTLPVLLLSKSTSKKWKNLNLSNCNLDDEGCKIFCEAFYPNAELTFETVNISCNSIHWESSNTICNMLKFCHAKNLVFSIDALYDTATANLISKFTAMLSENFENDTSSDSILLLTYVAKQNKLIAVYSSPTHIRWFEWIRSDCQLNETALEDIKNFVQEKIENKTYQIVFSYSLIDYHDFSTLFSEIQSVKLCGSFMHSKGAYLLNVASTIDCQYNSPQELIADYLSAVLSQTTQSEVPYIKSIPSAHYTAVENLLRRDLSVSLNTFDISDNHIDSKIASEISIFLSFINSTQRFYADNSKLVSESAIKITTNLQNITTLTVFSVNNNNVGEEAADDIAKALSHNTRLQTLNLRNNSIKTTGMIKIAEALKNNLILTVLDISNNNVCEKAANDIATALSRNNKLQELYLQSNSFKTDGIIKIAKALQNISTLTVLDISNNNIDEKAAYDIAKVLSHNNKLQKLNLQHNSFKTVGMSKIAKALQNISTLTWFSISNNNVDEVAADDIAKALLHNNKLQTLNLQNNSFKTSGMTKIAKALRNTSTLTLFSINNNNVGEEAAGDIAIALSRNTRLQTLDLNNNRFKTAGMIQIAKALQNTSTLTWFSITNNNVGEEAAVDIAAALSRNATLQTLDLQNNRFNAAGIIKIAKALQNISTLTVFDISNNNIGEQAADDIASVLSHNNKLQTLDLRNNSFKAAMIKIAKALQNNVTLTVLDISNNNIGEEAADEIATALSCNARLQTLNLQNNNFKTTGMIKIAKALQNISTLTWFDISSNNVSEEAAGNIAKALSHSTRLQALNLRNNSFKSAGIIEIAKALQNISTLTVLDISNNNVGEQAANYIAIVLSHNNKLKTLYLHNNIFKTAGIIKIAKALQNISTLAEFSINNNNVDDEAADDIAKVLYHNSNLKKVYLGGNNFQPLGTMKITEALKGISTLMECDYKIAVTS